MEKTKARAEVELLRAAFAAAPDGMIVVDPDGAVVAWNRAFLDLWELTPEVMALPRPELRRAVAARLEEDAEAFMAEAEEVQRDPTVELHRMVRLKDGRTLEMHSRPLSMGNGQVGRIWYYRDVTELVRTERELEEALRLLEAQFEGAPYGITAVARDGRLLRASARFYEFTGLGPEWAALPPQERARQLEALATDPSAAADFNRRWREAPNQSYSAVFERRGGGFFRVTTQPLTARGGEVLGQVFFYEDVTAEHTARAALEAQEAYLRALVEELEAGVVVVGRDWRFRMVNPAALRILGVSAAAMSGMTLEDFAEMSVREDGTPFAARECPSAVALETGATVRDVVMGVPRGDGELVWLLASASPLERGADGTVESVVTTFYDITGRRAMEEAMARARHLESLAALSAGLAHRLNNQLTAILGHAWMLAQGQELNEEGAESVREIQEVAREAARVVQDLRTFAAPTTGSSGEVDINAAVQAALARFGSWERSRLAVTLGAGLPRVRGTSEHLAQAVANIIDNALEAGPGVVEVRTVALDHDQATRSRRPRRWEPGPPGPGRYVAVLVEDAGPGMEEEVLERVFEPFFTTRFDGRGLGLPAAVGIVRRHRGHLGIETAPGRGTVAMLLLPAEG